MFVLTHVVSSTAVVVFEKEQRAGMAQVIVFGRLLARVDATATFRKIEKFRGANAAFFH